jgi:hypothetical protein
MQSRCQPAREHECGRDRSRKPFNNKALRPARTTPAPLPALSRHPWMFAFRNAWPGSKQRLTLGWVWGVQGPISERAGVTLLLLPQSPVPTAPMPPACPGDAYVFRYSRRLRPAPNAPGLPGGCLRFSLQSAAPPQPQCPRLARGMLTFFATVGGSAPTPMPPACPGDAYVFRYSSGGAICSRERDTPPGKPGASSPLCRNHPHATRITIQPAHITTRHRLNHACCMLHFRNMPGRQNLLHNEIS